MGMGSIKVCPPRVSDVREGDCFRSKILSRYQRASLTTKTLLTNLSLEGLSSGDFEPVFRALLGETAPLLASSILRLKQRWQGEYECHLKLAQCCGFWDKIQPTILKLE